jgi:hypothetical protein
MEPEEQPDILSLFGDGEPEPEPEPELKQPAQISPAARIASIKKHLRGLVGRRSLWEIWRDWVEMSALSLSQAVDRRGAVWEHREQVYLRTAAHYDADEMLVMAKMLGELVLVLEEGGPRDVLGEMFQELELASKWSGQFFTPMSLAELMASMTLSDAGERIEQRGFVTVSDPAVGAGALCLGVLVALLRMGYGPRNMVVFAQDVDLKAIYMAYLQLGLLGVPTVLFCANTISRPMVEADWMGVGDQPLAVWYTPSFVLDGWRARIIMAGAGDGVQGA